MRAAEETDRQRRPCADTLVLVDDDETVHMLVERMLRRTSLRLISFNDPERALHWLYGHRPAFLLIDYRMPRLSGLELLQALSGSVPALTRTLLCSAGRADTELKQALPGLSVELVDKRTLFDREHFLPALGITPL